MSNLREPLPIETQDGKIDFVDALVDNMRAHIVAMIQNGKIPAEWDGFELRQYIADYAAENCTFRPMTRSRKRDYKNTRLVNGIH